MFPHDISLSASFHKLNWYSNDNILYMLLCILKTDKVVILYVLHRAKLVLKLESVPTDSSSHNQLFYFHIELRTLFVNFVCSYGKKDQNKHFYVVSLTEVK